jgi:hydroxypyruvate isomerase
MNISRRNALKKMGAVMGSATVMGLAGQIQAAEDALENENLKGNINHSVCRWPYGSLSLEELCAVSNEIGIKGIEIVGPDTWETLKKYNLYCPMCNGAETGLNVGFSHTDAHSTLKTNYERVIPMVAEAGFKNLICFSGNSNGMDNETGMNNFVTGIKQIIGTAEKHGVVICLEMLNSRVSHVGYMADTTMWGVEVADRIGSDNFKLLYDIFHMQVMEGDIIARIRQYHEYFAHYHTGGVPGRNEIDETQELFYPAIMRAIVETGFTGYVGQEFVPSRGDAVASLRQGVHICDV